MALGDTELPMRATDPTDLLTRATDPHDDTVFSDGCFLDFYVLDLDLTYFICRITASCNISAISLQICTVDIRVASCNRMGLVCLVVL